MIYPKTQIPSHYILLNLFFRKVQSFFIRVISLILCTDKIKINLCLYIKIFFYALLSLYNFQKYFEFYFFKRKLIIQYIFNSYILDVYLQ